MLFPSLSFLGTPVQGVLVSLSNSDGYRKSELTNDKGEPSLSLLTYLQRYSFSGSIVSFPSQMKLKDFLIRIVYIPGIGAVGVLCQAVNEGVRVHAHVAAPHTRLRRGRHRHCQGILTPITVANSET